MPTVDYFKHGEDFFTADADLRKFWNQVFSSEKIIKGRKDLKKAKIVIKKVFVMTKSRIKDAAVVRLEAQLKTRVLFFLLLCGH